jgi:hypothetical protein
VHRILVTRARRPFLVGTLADYSEGSGYVAMPRAESKKKDAVLRKEFERLVKTWRADTKFTSSVHQMTLHPAYLRIIGMGRPALPLILTELEKRPDHWFAALYAITGANPVPDEDAGRVKRMAKHWLDWARRHGEF